MDAKCSATKTKKYFLIKKLNEIKNNKIKAEKLHEEKQAI